MNEQLIKFIELCLMDGVITDKEREVIFRKSKELGVPEDECEIILEGMIEQNKKNSPSSKTTTETLSANTTKDEQKKTLKILFKNSISKPLLIDTLNSLCDFRNKKDVELKLIIKEHEKLLNRDETITPIQDSLNNDKKEIENKIQSVVEEKRHILSLKPLIQEAAEILIENDVASASLLQRKLKLDYTQAGGLIDILEKCGIVGVFDGENPRQLITKTKESFNSTFYEFCKHSISSFDGDVEILRKSLSEIDEKLSENSFLFDETKDVEIKLLKVEGELVDFNTKIRSYYIISHLPQKLNGHSVFKGLFNYQSDLYSDDQLNKIVRFLNLIRNTEEKYTDLRNELIDGLNSTDLFPVIKLSGEDGLIDVFKKINLYYNLSQGLVDCIHSNKVGFNEIIIYLEDDGVFLSRPEIEKLNYLKKIGDHLSNIGNILIQTNNNMVNGFNRLDQGLITINESISITNEKIDEGLSTINSTLETGNKLIGEFIGTINNKFIEFEDEISDVRNDLSYVSDQVDDVQSGLWEIDSRVVDNKDKINSLSSLTYYNTLRK